MKILDGIIIGLAIAMMAATIVSQEPIEWYVLTMWCFVVALAHIQLFAYRS